MPPLLNEGEVQTLWRLGKIAMSKAGPALVTESGKNIVSLFAHLFQWFSVTYYALGTGDRAISSTGQGSELELTASFLPLLWRQQIKSSP